MFSFSYNCYHIEKVPSHLLDENETLQKYIEKIDFSSSNERSTNSHLFFGDFNLRFLNQLIIGMIFYPQFCLNKPKLPKHCYRIIQVCYISQLIPQRRVYRVHQYDCNENFTDDPSTRSLYY